MAEKIKLTIAGLNGSITECVFSNKEEYNSSLKTGVDWLKSDEELDFVILDKEVLPILYLTFNAKGSELRAICPDEITNTKKGFLLIDTPVGEIPVGSFSSDYNPSINTVIVLFGKKETFDGTNIYSNATMLGEIIIADAREENVNA